MSAPPRPGVAPGTSTVGGEAAGLVSRTRPVAAPGDLLDRLGAGGFAWLRDGAGFVTAGVAARIPVGTGPGRFTRAAAEAARLLGGIAVDDPLRRPGTGPLAVGALPFADGAAGELTVPALVVGLDASGAGWVTEVRRAEAAPPPDDVPGGAEWRAAVHRTAANGHARELPLPGAVDGAGARLRERPGREEWTEAVRRALADIAAGTLRKVVLAREVVLEALGPIDPRDVLDRLRRSHPSCFTYAAGAFVGASPELLVRRHGDDVLSCPMAGTAPRGATPEEDERLTGALRRSAKEAEEHRLLVEAVVEALAPACAAPPRASGVELIRLATVSHLATRVSARLRPPAPSALALVELLHPTPAVGGLPRGAALDAIAGLEGFDRGLYAGPVGWVDAAGDGEWAVALRGAELDGARARLRAGAGIVAGSDPDAEWAETEAKLAPMLAAVRV